MRVPSAKVSAPSATRAYGRERRRNASVKNTIDNRAYARPRDSVIVVGKY